MFSESRTAQMAAFFLDKTTEKKMPHLKLMKLLYLSDRESVQETGLPISWDLPVSMPHGPVLSLTLNLMNGDWESDTTDGWASWISGKENYEVGLVRSVSRKALDKLSDFDLDVLESVWARFGEMDQWRIRDWTHDHCAEWQDPDGSSRPISPGEILRAVGYNDESEIRNIIRIIEEQRSLSATLSKL